MKGKRYFKKLEAHSVLITRTECHMVTA